MLSRWLVTPGFFEECLHAEMCCLCGHFIVVVLLCVQQVTSHPWVLWGLSACRDVLSLWALHCCCAAVCSTGDIVTPGFFEDYLNAENVLWRPYGGGEQITFNIAYNLLTLHFMKRFNQLSSERLAIALNEINIGEDMLVFCLSGQEGDGGGADWVFLFYDPLDFG